MAGTNFFEDIRLGSRVTHGSARGTDWTWLLAGWWQQAPRGLVSSGKNTGPVPWRLLKSLLRLIPFLPTWELFSLQNLPVALGVLAEQDVKFTQCLGGSCFFVLWLGIHSSKALEDPWLLIPYHLKHCTLYPYSRGKQEISATLPPSCGIHRSYPPEGRANKHHFLAIFCVILPPCLRLEVGCSQGNKQGRVSQQRLPA